MAKKNSPSPKLNTSRLLLPVLVLLTVVIIVVCSYLSFLFYFQERLFPRIRIGQAEAGGQTVANLNSKFSADHNSRVRQPLEFSANQQTLQIDLQAAQPQLNYPTQIKAAYRLGHTDNFWQDLQTQFNLLFFGVEIPLQLTYRKPNLLISQINRLNQAIKKDPANAKLIPGDPITIIPSEEGLEIDDQLLLKQIGNYLSLTGQKPISLPVKTIKPKFSTSTARRYQQILEMINKTPLKLSFQKQEWLIDQKTLFSLLNFEDNQSVIAQTKLDSYLKSITNQINQDPQDARFSVDSSSGSIRVREFQPAKEGRNLEIDQTVSLINQALINPQPSTDSARIIKLPVSITQPKITTSSVNDFGIKELLGKGISYFTGSIQNRMYNIGLAASRLNGILIKPGEVFSFNNTVGDVSAATGYKPAYVIKSGRTVLDDGGGVCQVSTTLFRAVLNSGLPVIERTAHAYRVGYYEQGFPPGLDATVFSPSVDFKFKNDTPSYILIQAYTKGVSLYIDLYGTRDGRITTLSKSTITNQTPPPPELRQDDPTLPKGEVKQVDWSAWGANVSFGRTVQRGGETILQETWKSNYKPWQAIFLVGTKE